MQHKFVRADDSVISAVKSVRYTQQAIDNKCIRFGNCFSSCIEVTAYGTGSAIVANGEEIRYYKIYDVDSSFNPIDPPREEFIGTFTAISSIPSKNTFSFVAYDNLYKLSVDFSQHLASIKSSFPMTISDLLDEIESVAGVQINRTPVDWWEYNSPISINYFYADGITCRDIVSAIYEISGHNMVVGSNGKIGGRTFENVNPAPGWLDCKKYIIAPTDRITYYEDINHTVPLIPAFYKENGLNISDFQAQGPSKAIFKKSDGTILKEAAPLWPSVYPNEFIISGNIILDNIIIDADADFTLEYFCGVVAQRVYRITAGLTSSVYFNARNAEVHLFPFRNPYTCFMIAYAIDAKGRAFQFPIMKIVETDSDVALYCFENEYFDNSAQNYNSTDQNVIAISAIVNKLSDEVNGKVSKDGDTITGNLEVTGNLTNNGNAVLTAADVEFDVYDSVTDLGLTSGSATISGAYAAMSDNSILICTSGDFTSSEIPTGSAGTVVMVKRQAARGIILLYGKNESHKDYRMYLGSNNVPTGTWISQQANNLASVTDLTGYTSSSNLFTFPSDGYVFLANNSGQNGRGYLLGSGQTSSYLQFGVVQGRWTLFVRAGMKTYMDGTANVYRFVPLS